MADRSPGVLNRRALLGRVAGLLAVLTPASGCRKKSLVCADVTGLTAEEIQVRAYLQYADATPQQPDRSCVNCTLYVPPSEDGTCGTCKVMRGPVHPSGTCKAFLLKSEGGAPS